MSKWKRKKGKSNPQSLPGKRKNCENVIKKGTIGMEKPFLRLGRPSVASWDSTIMGAWLWFHENTYNDFTVYKTCERSDKASDKYQVNKLKILA